MTGYREGSGWSDQNELRCLLIFKRLEAAGYPHGLQTSYAREVAVQTGLSVSTIKAKVGNYKSLAGASGESHASTKSREIFERHGHRSIRDLEKLIA